MLNPSGDPSEISDAADGVVDIETKLAQVSNIGCRFVLIQLADIAGEYRSRKGVGAID